MQIFIAVLIGFVSGYLAGQLGIGGGLLTTPAIRIILQKGAFMALGTPLAVIIPAAVIGALNYSRKHLIDWQLGINIALSGLAGSIFGCYATKYFNGEVLMLIISFVIFLVSLRFIFAGLAKGMTSLPHKVRLLPVTFLSVFLAWQPAFFLASLA